MSRLPDPRVAVRAVYVHAPFCARRCFYCDFAVSVAARPDPEPWLEAIARELAFVESRDANVAELETLYVGGGTPSLLGPSCMAGLKKVLRGRLGRGDLEWTAEANPESFDQEIASGWSRAGVNRISFGAQSFHGPSLRWMGRLHDVDGPSRALRDARMAGIMNASVDLIFGLPEALGRRWADDLDRALELDVPHLSLYGLTVESRTPLGRAVREGREHPADESRYAEEFLEAAECLTESGYEHYEVSSFARPGYRSRHNSVYWSGAPYLGLGNGAHSFLPPVRRWNLRDWEEYRKSVSRGQMPVENVERLGPEETRLERIWLGLRTREGIPCPEEDSPAGRLLSTWNTKGLAEAGGRGLRLTPRGWLLLDQLAVELDGAMELG